MARDHSKDDLPLEGGPFHEGELQAQAITGETAEAESNSAMIGDTLMMGASPFVRAQEMAVMSSRDAAGRRWASFLFGAKGFLEQVDRKTLRIRLDPTRTDFHDPVWKNLEGDPRIGLLVIDLGSRRRIRINGTVSRDREAFELAVAESFPNCPKYITRREVRFAALPANAPSGKTFGGSGLQAQQKKIIGMADVLFIATGHPERGADISHRGGRPGFVEIIDDKTLRIPDYSGNSLFNTFGNLLVDPHVGVLVPEFESGRALQLTGKATIEWHGESHDKDGEDTTGGTHRFVDIAIEEWNERALPVKVSSTVIDYSPYDP